MQILDAAATRALLELRPLMGALRAALADYARGEITCPERLVVPCGGGAGALLSMPCQAPDLVVHKLLTLYAGNPGRGLPAIQGQVTAFAAEAGVPLFGLDGPATTSKRTAALSMLGIERLHPGPPETVTVIGTGVQARAHVEAVLELYPDARVQVRGTGPAQADAFCASLPDGSRVSPQGAGTINSDVVIAVTSSRTPVYDQPAEAGRLVIGVGAYRLDMVEVGRRTVAGSQVYVDDPVGAPGEAGDVAAAGIDWSTVTPLARAFEAAPDHSRPIFLKSVGCGAWDLAACRAARQALRL